jgi:hypothetical protein
MEKTSSQFIAIHIFFCRHGAAFLQTDMAQLPAYIFNSRSDIYCNRTLS